MSEDTIRVCPSCGSADIYNRPHATIPYCCRGCDKEFSVVDRREPERRANTLCGLAKTLSEMDPEDLHSDE